jgi:acetyltransferase-like isoleucine patch superfamily enzyme
VRGLLGGLLRRSGRDSSFELDGAITTRDAIAVAARVGEYAARGALRRLSLADASGAVLIGRRVRLLHAGHIHLGANVVLEDDVEIVGLATKGIWLGESVAIGRGTLIKPTSYYGRNLGEGLRMGARSSIGPFGYLGCSGFISIGANVLIGPRVSMHAENHRFDEADIAIREQGVTLKPIAIEDDCWIGSDVVLVGGVTIGRGAVVGAGSVVTKSVAPGEVVGGVPARVIKSRDSLDRCDE